MIVVFWLLIKYSLVSVWPVSFKGKPEIACESPRCTVVPVLQPTLHIADQDPIPEEQVRVKIAFVSHKGEFHI